MSSTDYSKGKIYKIVCEDGKFYIGSTVLSIKARFAQHSRAVQKGVNSKVYRHIRALGGPEKSRIELVAANLGISTRDELLKIEDSYIREGMRTKMCLNRNKPRATADERAAREILQRRMWKKLNRDARRSEPTTSLAERIREYYRNHKSLPKPRLVDCECGYLVYGRGLYRHLKTNEHKDNLRRRLVHLRL